jgi:hypothetical protein
MKLCVGVLSDLTMCYGESSPKVALFVAGCLLGINQLVVGRLEMRVETKGPASMHNKLSS